MVNITIYKYSKVSYTRLKYVSGAVEISRKALVKSVSRFLETTNIKLEININSKSEYLNNFDRNISILDWKLFMKNEYV